MIAKLFNLTLSLSWHAGTENLLGPTDGQGHGPTTDSWVGADGNWRPCGLMGIPQGGGPVRSAENSLPDPMLTSSSETTKLSLEYSNGSLCPLGNSIQKLDFSLKFLGRNKSFLISTKFSYLYLATAIDTTDSRPGIVEILSLVTKVAHFYTGAIIDQLISRGD